MPFRPRNPRPSATVGMGSPAGGHIPALDGLRGLAVLAVMAYHFFLLGGAVPLHAIDRIPYALAMAGWTGVDLFFVLSGFLITGILFDTRHQSGFFQTFYIRRFLRIFPLYYGFLFLSFYVLPGLLHLRETEPATRLSLWTYLLNLHVGAAGWEVVPEHLAPFWSLAIEEQFYLLWPMLVFALPRRRLLGLCGAMVLASLVIRIWLHARGADVAAYVLTPARMDTLAVGAALALAWRDPHDRAVALRWARPMLLVGVPLLGVITVWRDGLAGRDPVGGTIGLTLLAGVFGAVLLLAVNGSPGARYSRFLCSGSLRFFGKYSYGLYVVHQAVALPLPALGITAAALSPVAALALPGQLAFMAVATSLSVATALLSWHLFEKHFLRLKSRFAYGSPAPATEGAPVPVPVRPS